MKPSFAIVRRNRAKFGAKQPYDNSCHCIFLPKESSYTIFPSN